MASLVFACIYKSSKTGIKAIKNPFISLFYEKTVTYKNKAVKSQFHDLVNQLFILMKWDNWLLKLLLYPAVF
jgi:hypothetical protein